MEQELRPEGAIAAETAAEQVRVDRAYARLDELRALAGQRLDEVRRTGGGTPAARTERDAFATLYEDRLVQLRAVEDRLVFGRMDRRDGGAAEVATLYVGRTGLLDEEQETLLTDWRAPRSSRSTGPRPPTPSAWSAAATWACAGAGWSPSRTTC